MCCLLQVELFVLAPPCGGRKERERVRELLRKNAERVKISSNLEVDQPEELQLPNIRSHSYLLETLLMPCLGPARVQQFPMTDGCYAFSFRERKCIADPCSRVQEMDWSTLK